MACVCVQGFYDKYVCMRYGALEGRKYSSQQACPVQGVETTAGHQTSMIYHPFLSPCCGSCARFDMFESLGLVVILGGLALAQANSSSEIPLILSLFIIMPILMMIFVRCRHEKTERLELHLFFCQTEVLSLIQQITSNFRLITDYWQQPTMVKAFGGKVQATNKAAMAALIRKIENGELLGFAKDLGTQDYNQSNWPFRLYITHIHPPSDQAVVLIWISMGLEFGVLWKHQST